MFRNALVSAVLLFVLVLSVSTAQAQKKENLVFGAIAVGKVSKVKKSLQPLLTYLEQKTGTTITFETGKDYADTIEKFQNGYFDFGFIGPSPYVLATSGAEGAGVFNILGGIETKGKPFFHAAIIAAKDNTAINSLEDLKGKKFAFGSRQSTLSFYVPCKMLMDSGVFGTLEKYDFLGKHDKVAKYVAMGGYDAGGIKEAVANKNLDSIKIIAKSLPIYDFLFVAHKGMDAAQTKQLRTALLELKDRAILGSIKKGVTAITPTKDSNYDSLRTVMKKVEADFK